MRTKIGCGVAVLFLVIPIVFCVFVHLWTERPRCTLPTLVLNHAQLPGEWKVSDPDLWPAFLPTQDLLGAQEAYATILANPDGGIIGHTVYRYRNRWLAAFYFWFNQAVFFASISTDWSSLEATEHLPLHADQRRIRCGIIQEPYPRDKCSAVLRYGPFISDFDLSVGEPGDLSLEAFLQIVVMIDEQFRSCGY